MTTQPGCVTPGVKTYTCTVCGQTRTEEVSALGHSFEGGLCTRCGAADPSALPPVPETP